MDLKCVSKKNFRDLSQLSRLVLFAGGGGKGATLFEL